jgi:Holliday junction DNA helicase RuvA
MIGRLRGKLAHKSPPGLVVDVNGVGYELEAPMSTFYELPVLGAEVSLFTHYAQKEDSVSLYGFASESERRLFRDVQRVTGIGAKIALAVLSGASVEEFARRVQAGDVAALTRIPGIGKKTAERMVVELAGMPNEIVSPAAIQYINRLSDFLFVASRYVNDKGAREVLTCVFARKPEAVAEGLDAWAWDAPHRYLVGYGMDDAGKMRGLPFVGAIKGA